MELHEDGVKSDAPGTKVPVQQSASVQLSTSKKFQALSSSMCDLDAITIAELCPHKRHFGRVLCGHFRIKPLISELVDDITTILVDANEDTIRLITSKRLWVVVPVEDIENIFSLGKRVAIKEPLMNTSSDGMYAVRVIDPAELIFLEDVNASDHARPESSDTPSPEQLRKLIIDEIIDPAESSDGSSVEKLRNIRLESSRFFAQENLLAVLDLHSRRINLTLLSLEKNGSTKTKGEEDLRRILMLAYSARAEVRLRLQQYEDALRDADEALEIEPKHVKSLVRKGKAAHQLGVFEKSCRAFKAALDESPHDQSIAKSLRMSLTALQQSLTGGYDLDYYLYVGEDPPCPSCADFVGPVEIRKGDGTRGRGLFATRRLQAGDDIVVSNPLAVVHNPAISSEWFYLIKEQLRNKATTSKRQKAQLCSLAWFGGREMEIPSMELFRPGSEWLPSDTEKLEVDLEEVIFNILSHNTRFFKFQGRSKGIDGDSSSRSFVGVWGLPSFVNHSCAPNCLRSFVGEVIFLRACRDILEGEELTINYIAPNFGSDIGTRQAETHRKWLSNVVVSVA